MNIAGNERHSNALVLGQCLQSTDKSVSFFLRGPDLAIPSMGDEVWEIPCELLPSSDHS